MRHGDVNRGFRTVGERFWEKVDRTGDCWLWTGATLNTGYGCFHLEGRTVLSHRLGYELQVAPIPEGMTLDHLCKTPLCVRGTHLEPVPNVVNVARADVSQNGQSQRDKTACPAGHPYDSTNTYVSKAGKRSCRTCQAERSRVYKAKRRQLATC